MEENVYVKLCNHLNEYPLWAPAAEEFLEILRVMFTPDEAELALNLTPQPESVTEIAGKCEIEIYCCGRG